MLLPYSEYRLQDFVLTAALAAPAVAAVVVDAVLRRRGRLVAPVDAAAVDAVAVDAVAVDVVASATSGVSRSS